MKGNQPRFFKNNRQKHRDIAEPGKNFRIFADGPEVKPRQDIQRSETAPGAHDRFYGFVQEQPVQQIRPAGVRSGQVALPFKHRFGYNRRKPQGFDHPDSLIETFRIEGAGRSSYTDSVTGI